jgi:hypothetical protein
MRTPLLTSPQEDGRIAPGTVKVANPVAAFGAHLAKDVMLFVVVETATTIPDADWLDLFLAAGAFNAGHKEGHEAKSDPSAEQKPKQKSADGVDQRR